MKSVLHYTMKSVLTIEKCFNYCLIVLTIVKYVLNTVKSVLTTMKYVSITVKS